MPHVLVAGKLHPSGREILASAEGFTVTFVEEPTEASYQPHIAEADAVLIRTQPMNVDTVKKADRLKIVSRHGVGYDAINVDALNARGITLAVCGEVNSTSVAEHAAMMILAAAKRAIQADRSVRQGPWEWRNELRAQEVRGKNLLLAGYGRIARHTAAMMRGFGMKARAYDPFLMESGWPGGHVPPVQTLEEGLNWADVISVSVPYTGKPLIRNAEFHAMCDGVILVNTSRGGVVDEDALVEALISGKVSAAGLDVFEQEPLPQDHPFLGFDQVVLSPHIAGLTDGAAERMAIRSAQNIVDFFAGRIDPALVVNKGMLNGNLQT